ncbi:AAA family ATPase [Agaribacillus aureus]|uniref:AAA family ATPase n=1 Tax=Agaribacillus aureus TaxID=3051825 RepID=UPI00321195A6
MNTRNKENKFLETCLATQSQFVVDNTNPTSEERKKYIVLAKAKKYEVIGYYFHLSLVEALDRNKARKGKERIPEIGIKGCYSKLELPSLNEGYDKLYHVKSENMGFEIKDWKDEIR